MCVASNSSRLALLCVGHIPADVSFVCLYPVVTSEYGWAVSEKRIKRLLKEDVMAAQLLELAASPPRPATPPGQEEGNELAVKAENSAQLAGGDGGSDGGGGVEGQAPQQQDGAE